MALLSDNVGLESGIADLHIYPGEACYFSIRASFQLLILQMPPLFLFAFYIVYFYINIPAYIE